MSIGLLGKKLGMTRIYDEKGRISPATVIAAGGNRILQTKSIEKDKYTSVQVGFDDQKPQRVGKAMTGHFAKTSSTAKRFIREFRLADNAATPETAELPVTNFEVGQFVDVIGQSKGKGFQGTIKRHNFAGQPMTHGSTMHRRNGAIGNRSTPGRVWKNMGMPGHMGDEQVTVQNLRVLQVRSEEGVIVVAGAIPGAKGSYVVVRPAIKKTTK
ncbi:MAG: 50S ribosomal protein L3 [Spartobacteria bacterium Tous-C9RFEB]|jgi:large subunit ribosomal protein L3|nr:MAG: 50S ribosomal protein L3 [Spartobacteria bacterium Tous-C9RFEB]